ncbi:MAG TPA: oxygen-dependent coproporphyrinogen oxidase [Cryomorphaceae bacterium]|nr:oxygen-dependent coproporphyrinogen oxidase [Cryomorphaceae bacterium]
MSTEVSKEHIAESYRKIQSDICSAIESADGTGLFKSDHWNRDEGGGGHTRILEGGSVLEKAGVNFSEVHGPFSDVMKQSMQTKADAFFATGVSIVMHPNNPHIPIIHMNIRYFEMNDGTYWFGGGIDLTPHYVQREQASYFHKELKDVCDKYDSAYYSRFKEWADDYFFIPHRNETRGVGGIFYDHLSEDEEHSKSSIFNFSEDLGKLFPKIYTHLINENRGREYSEEEKEWQMVRRGRYVEFNLVYDRGTKFGLQSNGRTESILMSLPRQAMWFYNLEPKENSPEAETIALLKKGVDWLS